MPEHERKNTQKQEKTDSKNRTNQKESELLYDQINTVGIDMLPVTETPFQPPVEKHAALLAKVSRYPQRANLILRLQRTYGNAYVQRLLESHTVQSRLTVSRPGDQYEQEAERVSEMVTRDINSRVNRQPEEEEEEQIGSFLQRQEEEEEEETASRSLLQRQEEEEEEETQTISSLQRQSAALADNLETRIENARGNGQSLSDNIRVPMEQAFGADFSSVSVHTDAEADTLNRELNARAFTTGSDIFFRQGEYSPGSGSGQKLIAHELTHVVQQTGKGESRRKVNRQRTPKATRKTMPGLSGSQQRIFASSRRDKSPNPFASQHIITRINSGNSHISPFIQRYTANSSDNKVKFESTSFNAVGSGPLDLSNKNNDWFQAKSNVYAATGTVKASGGWSLTEGKWTQDVKQAPNDVKDWKVGMMQTAYSMSRYGYYPDPAQNYKRNGGSVASPPVRDAFVGSPYPWYDGNRTFYPTCWQDFGAEAENTQSVRMGDQPATCDMPWFKGPDTKQPISTMAGLDSFVTHLAVYNKNKNEIIYLNNAVWMVNFTSAITVDAKTPLNSTFKGGGTGVVSVNEGTGWPAVTSGDVANSYLSKTQRTWETY